VRQAPTGLEAGARVGSGRVWRVLCDGDEAGEYFNRKSTDERLFMVGKMNRSK